MVLIVDYPGIATLLGFLTLLGGGLKLWWDARRAREDSKVLKEGIAALYKVVESNRQVVESLMSHFGRTAGLSQEQLVLEKSRLELDRLKTFGRFAKYLIENSD